MKNKMTDLNNVLFEQLERLQDDEAMKDDTNFKREIERSRAIVGVSSQIIKNATLTVQAARFVAEYGSDAKTAVAGLIGENESH